MKKKFALALATIATVATVFTGCGQKDISGDYTSTMKLSEFMQEDDLSEFDEMGLDVNSLTLDVKLNLTEDKNFTMSFDTTDFKEQFKTLMTENSDAIIDSILESEGISRADITDEMAPLLGYDNADAFFEDLNKELVSAMDSELDSIDSEMKEYTVKGTYSVSKNNVIFVTEDDDEMALDSGTLNEDGSIHIDTEAEDGTEFSLDFILDK